MIRFAGRFLFLTAFQIFILNNIQLFGYANPYLYVLFLLVLPANIGRVNLLLLGALSGWVLDIFENSGGIHTSAMLTLALLRPYILRFVIPRAEEDLSRISLWTMGGGRFFSYMGIAVLIHHLWLFGMEAFSLREIFSVLSRTLVSAPLTLVMIYITQLFVYREEA